MNGPTQRSRSGPDSVSSLPTDKTLPRRSELDTADQIFSQEPTVTNKLVEQGKEIAIILVVVFVVVVLVVFGVAFYILFFYIYRKTR